MAPNKQKMVRPRKTARVAKKTAQPGEAKEVKFKLNFTRGHAQKGLEKEKGNGVTKDGGGREDGKGKAMRNAKMEGIQSPPPALLSLPPPDPSISSPPTLGPDSPRLPTPLSQDVRDILATLRAAPEMQIDLPTMTSGTATKPYTAAMLTALYTTCYAAGEWHVCDLVADTWIRALQGAKGRGVRTRSRKAGRKMWRVNKALERRFREGKLGFKEDVVELGLEVEDPELHANVLDFSPQHLREVYANTQPGSGARLLWADALALMGREAERGFLAHQNWPADLCYDVMCTSLRMVGRKLTLKIEERYEGAWCGRYHEHGKRGLVCYRRVAREQVVAGVDKHGRNDEDVDAEGESEEG